MSTSGGRLLGRRRNRTQRGEIGTRLASLWPRRSDYRELRTSWRADIAAGLTVGVVALPLALAFGISSGVGAAAGLVTAVVAGIVAAVFGGSHVQVSGPTGAMAVILAPIVAQHGLSSIALVTIMAGLLVFLTGVVGLGRAVLFIPWPVIEGFTLGIAAIIFLQQVPAAVAMAVPTGEQTLIAAIRVLIGADWTAALPALGVVGLVAVLMILLPRLHSSIPASLLAVVIATVVVTVIPTGWLPADVARIGELPAHLPAPHLPGLDPETIRSLMGAAVAIAALAAIESLLSARVAASMSTTGQPNPDRELSGQGLASVASGFFGGMPATGAIARTAVNVRSGARTRVAALVHALFLLAVVYLASGPVAEIPLAALAGVLMVTAVRMVSRVTIRRILHSTRSDAVIFTLTAVITVGFDLIIAVQIGLVATSFVALRALSQRSGVTAEDPPGEYHPGDERIALLRLDGAMFFGAAERISADVHDAVSAPHTRVVIIRMSRVGMLDATGANVLGEMITDLEARGLTVIIKGVLPEHHTLLSDVGVFDSLRHHRHLLDSLDEAVAHARSHIERESAAGGSAP